MNPSLRYMIASLLIAAVAPIGMAALDLEQPAFAKNGNGEAVPLIDLFHPLKSPYSRSWPRIEHGLVRNRPADDVMAGERAR